MNAWHHMSAVALIPGALDGWWIIGCEESGTIRDVFNAAGVRTISCDLKPSKTVGPHFQGDIRKIWRLHRWAGAIVHPDCTFLTLAGVRWLFDRSPSTAKVLKGPERWKALFAAAEFFNWLTDTAPTDMKLCAENPIMHGYAKALIHLPVSQYVQPYHHGHLETKATGLHLRNLPLLEKTDDVEAAMRLLPKRETHKVHYASPGDLRAEQRSTFFTGIASAMLAQWATQHKENCRMSVFLTRLLDELADEIYPEGRQFIDTDSATFHVRKEWANKLRAIRAAVGGEAVAWRRVHVWPDGKRRGPHGPWRDIAERVDEQHGDSIEYAYASPPATVDVGALRELVEKWRVRERGYQPPESVRIAVCADELAALIGKEA